MGPGILVSWRPSIDATANKASSGPQGQREEDKRACTNTADCRLYVEMDNLFLRITLFGSLLPFGWTANLCKLPDAAMRRASSGP